MFGKTNKFTAFKVKDRKNVAKFFIVFNLLKIINQFPGK